MSKILKAIGAAADWFEDVLGRKEVPSNDLYFDSDAHLAEIKNKVDRHYY